MIFLSKVFEKLLQFIDREQQPEQFKLNNPPSQTLSQSLYLNNNKNLEIALRQIVKLRTSCLVKVQELMKKNEKLFSQEIDFNLLIEQLFQKNVEDFLSIDKQPYVKTVLITNLVQLQKFVENLFLYIEVYSEQVLKNQQKPKLSEELSQYLQGELKYSLYQIIVDECFKQKPEIMKGLEFAFENWLTSQDYSIKMEELRQKLNDPRVPNGMAKGLIEETSQVLKARLKNHLERSQNFRIGDIFLYHYSERLSQKLKGIVTTQIHKRYKCSEEKRKALKSQCYEILQKLLETQNTIEELLSQESLQNLQLIVLYAVDLVEYPHLVYAFYGLIQALGKAKYQFDEFPEFPLQHKKFREDKEHDCKRAINWWKNNISQDTNLTVMIHLYLLTGGIKVQVTQDRKEIQGYCPEKKLMLTLIFRHLNNGQLGCLNYEVLRACERIRGQIMIESINSLKQSPLILGYISVENYLLKLQVATPKTKSKEPEGSHKIFYLLFHQKSKGIDQGKLDARERQKNDELIGIAEKHKYLGEIPKQFSFQLLSKPQKASNVLTICITGFTTEEDTDYEVKWAPLLASSTVIALRWGSGTTFGQGWQIMRQIYNLINSPNIQKGFDKLYFNKIVDEAIKVGKFLGFLIGQCEIFKDCLINLVGHSLGTLVIDECIKVLDKQYSQDPVIHINSVVLLGGVADVRRLARNRWHSVGGHIYNLYSSNDSVLNYLLWAVKYYQKPCGLQEISHIYRKIENYDTSDFVKGHSEYYNHLEEILKMTDFDNDCKFYYNDIY